MRFIVTDSLTFNDTVLYESQGSFEVALFVFANKNELNWRNDEYKYLGNETTQRIITIILV